jgi:O-antigen/teichoic acid export membrane protein
MPAAPGRWRRLGEAARNADWKRFRRSSFGAGVLLTLGSNVVHMTSAFVTGVLAARLLGPAGRGELAAIQSWAPFIATVAMLGLPEAVTHFSGRHPARSREFWATGTVGALVAAVPLVAAGILLMPWLLAAQPEATVTAARWYLAGLTLVFAFQWMPLAVLRGRRDFGAWNALQLLPTAAWIITMCGCFVVECSDAAALAWTYLLLIVATTVPMVVVTLRRTANGGGVTFGSVRSMLQYGLPLVVASMPQWLWTARLPQTVMAAWLSPAALGLFAVATAWGNLTSPLTQAIAVVLFPEVTARDSDVGRHAVLVRTVRASVWLSIACGIPLVVMTPYLLPLVFGAAFAPASLVAVVMVAAGSVVGLKTVLDHGLRGLGRTRMVMLAEGIGFGVTVTVAPVAVASWGLMGAALATLAGYASAMLYLFHTISRETGASIMALIGVAHSGTTEV